MALRDDRGNCRRCVHFRERGGGWWCSLVSIEKLQAKGYAISADNLPAPEAFVCGEDGGAGYEPP
jgi:hypothetical protein